VGLVEVAVILLQAGRFWPGWSGRVQAPDSPSTSPGRGAASAMWARSIPAWASRESGAPEVSVARAAIMTIRPSVTSSPSGG
jgi:hypothetical protein